MRRSLQIAILIAVVSTHSIGSITQNSITLLPCQQIGQSPLSLSVLQATCNYVGTDELACFLITTPQGHILINSGAAGSVPLIRSSVAALGFKFSDIKILLATHVHHDYAGGMAEIKRITGARMMIEAHDAPILADGGNSDYGFGGRGNLFQPVKADSL